MRSEHDVTRKRRLRLHNLPPSGPIRGVVAIIGGAAGAQLILGLSIPVLARLYKPAEFGLFAVAFSIVVTIGAIGTLRFDAAVPIPSERTTATAIVRLAVFCNLLITALLMICCLLWRHPIANALNVPTLSGALWLVPICGSLLALFQLYNQLAIRDQRYSATARRTLLSAAVTVSAQLTLGLLGIGAVGLLVGYGLGQAAGLCALAVGAGVWTRRVFKGADTRPPSARSLALRFARFPILMAPSSLLNVMSLQAPILVVAALYGPAMSGFLGMTQRALGLPIALIGVAVGQVYLGEMSKVIRRSPESALTMFARASKALAACSLLTVVPLLIFAPWVFSHVLGHEWLRSGIFAQALALALGAQLVASPLSSTLAILERQGTLLILDTVRLFATVGSIFGAWALGMSAVVAVWALGFSSVVTYILYWYASRTALRRNIHYQPLSQLKESS